MPKNNKPLTLTLHPVDVGASFPAIWEGLFNRLPEDDEVRAKKTKIRRFMQEDLDAKEANEKATPGFKLHYDWRKIPYDPRRIFLKVTATRPIKKSGEGEVTPPTPKSPPPPPQ